MDISVVIAILLKLFPGLDPKILLKALQCVPWTGVQSASLDGAELTNPDNPADLPWDVDIHLTCYVLEAWHGSDYYRLTVPYVPMLGGASLKINGVKAQGSLSGADDADADIVVTFGDHKLAWVRK
jgi:hypothetical protein